MFLLLVLCSLFLTISVSAASTPNDPFFPDQWHLQAINAPEAWGKTTGSRQVVVAVLDAGVEVAHPDLQDNIWTNPGEIPFNGIDDDRNGLVDDVRGWDFLNNTPNPGPDFSASSTTGGLHHGTMIAGLIGAVGNNGTDGVGVNWQVQIMPLKVLSEEGTGEAKTVVQAIDYAIAKKADVINLSFINDPKEGPLAESFYRALQRAYLAGIVTVVAAGNDAAGQDLIGGDLDFNPRYPVCYDGPQGEPWWVIGVAALDQNDQKANFSDYGFRCVDISAPGVQMASALVYHPHRDGFKKSFGGKWSGTSLAAPLVSGAAALIKSLRPDFGPKEIYDALTKSADNLDAKNLFYPRQLGAGKLNLGRALALAAQAAPAAGPVDKPSPASLLLIYKQSKSNISFYDINGQKVTYGGWVKIYQRKDLPKKAILFYNKYKGKLAIAKGDVDADGKEEFVTAKLGLNPKAIIWSSKGKKKGEMKIKGDYRKGIGLILDLRF